MGFGGTESRGPSAEHLSASLHAAAHPGNALEAWFTGSALVSAAERQPGKRAPVELADEVRVDARRHGDEDHAHQDVRDRKPQECRDNKTFEERAPNRVGRFSDRLASPRTKHGLRPPEGLIRLATSFFLRDAAAGHGLGRAERTAKSQNGHHGAPAWTAAPDRWNGSLAPAKHRFSGLTQFNSCIKARRCADRCHR